MTCDNCIHTNTCKWFPLEIAECSDFEEKRPRGEWVPSILKGTKKDPVAWKCSVCGRSPVFAVKSDFCPNCGASMSANDRQVTGKLDENTQKHYGFRKKY